MYHKRTSKKRFSFLYPHEMHVPYVISVAVAEQLRSLDLSGVSIGRFEDTVEAVTLHVANEAPVTDARAQRCERCGALVIDAKQISASQSSIQLQVLDEHIQLVRGRLLVSDLVLRHIQPEIDASLHPPHVEHFGARPEAPHAG